MPRRLIQVDGRQWQIVPTGRTTPYSRDEFGLLFSTAGAAGAPERRVVRYSPLGARSPEASLAELSDHQLSELLATSQPARTAPETGYQP